MIPLRVDIMRTRVALMNALLIVANTLAFLYELSLPAKAGNRFIAVFGLTPSHEQLLFAPHGISLGQAIVPIFTSMFLHGGWMHLLGNMLFLWVFGGAVEDAMGHLTYLIFYLLCGAGAAATHLFVNWGSKIPTVGASGAISGVMGAFIVLYPTSRVTTLFPIIIFFFTVRIPAVLMLGYWFFLQLFSGVASFGMSDQGGVAWWAHVGGFVLGAILAIRARPNRQQAYAG